MNFLFFFFFFLSPSSHFLFPLVYLPLFFHPLSGTFLYSLLLFGKIDQSEVTLPDTTMFQLICPLNMYCIYVDIMEKVQVLYLLTIR